MIDAQIFSVLPPIAKAEEEKRDAQGEVIKTHKKKIVVGKQKAKPTE